MVIFDIHVYMCLLLYIHGLVKQKEKRKKKRKTIMSNTIYSLQLICYQTISQFWFYASEYMKL